MDSSSEHTPVSTSPRASSEYSGSGAQSVDASGAVAHIGRGGKWLGIADRYIFWQMVSATLRGLMWFGGLLFLITVINSIRKGLNDAIPVSAVLWAIVYQLPRAFLFTLPMSLLFGTVQTFSELSARSEITALWAGGMSLKRMMRGPLMWALLLSVTAFGVQEFLVPGAEYRSARVFEEKTKESLEKQKNFRYSDPPPGKGTLKIQIQAQSYDAKTNALVRPNVYLFYDDGSQKLTIDAERGWFNEATGLWRFEDALIRFFPKGERTQTIAENSAAGVRSEQRYKRIENSLDGYADATSIRRAADFRTRYLANGRFELVSIADLLSYRAGLQKVNTESNTQRLANSAAAKAGAKRDREAERLIGGATYGIHDKIATPLICLALVLVGAPLAVRPQRASSGFAIGLSFMVIAVYYMLWTLASYAGREGKMPIPSAYLALAVTTLLGLFFLRQKNR